MEGAEAAAEGGGRTNGIEEGAASEGGADEAGERGEADEDLVQHVFVTGAYGGRR